MKIIRFTNPLLAGKFLAGPRDSMAVRKDGYAVTGDPAEAWPFAQENHAAAKGRIVARHLGIAGEPFELVEL